MPYNLITNIESCYITVPHLLYYSHIPAMVVALLFGFFVYFKNRRKSIDSFASRILLFVSIAFTLWSVLDMMLWLSVNSGQIMFYWSVVNFVENLVTAGTLYFSYVFLEKKDLPLVFKLIIGLLLSGFLVFLPTTYNITDFNVANCEAEQGSLIYYFYFLEILFFVSLLAYLIRKIILSKKDERNMVILFSIGAVCFLASFSGANILGSLTEHWEILQYGLFGMPFFMAFLAYLIVRYKVFNIKLVSAQFLVALVIILIGSEFFFINNPVNKVLTAITLALVVAFGWWLVRSVKQEIARREETAELAKSLAEANLRLQELDRQKTDFLSIASHQLRTPLSIAKGYIELIQDGAYGKVSSKIKNILGEMGNSNEHLVKLVDDFLDITRIEQGRTKFVFANGDLNKLAEDVAKEFNVRAKNKGLSLSLALGKELPQMHMDEEKIRHVIFNFVDNAIKYSEKGSIKITSAQENGGIKIVVSDHGRGFGEEDRANFFQKFYRGKNVQGTNVTGTGLGLYVCRKFIEAHSGRVWSESPGTGKGSSFCFWLPFGEKNAEQAIKMVNK